MTMTEYEHEQNLVLWKNNKIDKTELGPTDKIESGLTQKWEKKNQ